MTLFEELKWRGLIKDTAGEDLEKIINGCDATFYWGTDPTADSLHIGHYSTFLTAKRLQKAGADGMRVGIASGQICFTPNTKVWYISPSGKMYQKEIQHIEVGDKVITASGRARKVVNKFINDYSGEIYKIEGENISATPTHKFYTFNTITHAKEFIEIANIDDRFMTFINAEGKTLEKQIDIDEYTGKVYNIEVEDEHTYLVTKYSILVHNAGSRI